MPQRPREALRHIMTRIDSYAGSAAFMWELAPSCLLEALLTKSRIDLARHWDPRKAGCHYALCGTVYIMELVISEQTHLDIGLYKTTRLVSRTLKGYRNIIHDWMACSVGDSIPGTDLIMVLPPYWSLETRWQAIQGLDSAEAAGSASYRP